MRLLFLFHQRKQKMFKAHGLSPGKIRQGEQPTTNPVCVTGPLQNTRDDRGNVGKSPDGEINRQWVTCDASKYIAYPVFNTTQAGGLPPQLRPREPHRIVDVIRGKLG